jgi:hypothetical protein
MDYTKDVLERVYAIERFLEKYSKIGGSVSLCNSGHRAGLTSSATGTFLPRRRRMLSASTRGSNPGSRGPLSRRSTTPQEIYGRVRP